MSDRYWLIVDPLSRKIERRTKVDHPPIATMGRCWCEVTRAIWKQYRAGDIVAPGDLDGRAMDELMRLAMVSQRSAP